MEQWKSDARKVWWNSGTMIVYSVVEHWNSDGGTVWWNSETVMVE